MSHRSITRLVGVIRLAESTDSIGVPVFGWSGMNHHLIAETDASLNIVRFAQFYNEEQYRIVYEVPVENRSTEYSISDACPIPIFIAGEIRIIGGDRQATDAESLKPDRQYKSGAFDTLVDTLRKARSGYFLELAQRWKAEGTLTAFSDVVEDEPAASRYWVTRYRAAIGSTLRGGQVNAEFAETFRRIGSSWLRKFATKTDVARVSLLFGKADDGVFNKDDLTSGIFAVFVNEFAKGGYKALYRTAKKERDFSSLFPSGIYYHYIERGFPEVPFQYSKPSDFLEPLLDKISGKSKRLKSRMFAPGVSDVSMLGDAREMAYVLFGTKDAPKKIHDVLDGMRNDRFDDLRRAQLIETHFRRRRSALASARAFDAHLTPEWRSMFTESYGISFDDDRQVDEGLWFASVDVIQAYNDLLAIDGIAYGDARLKSRADDLLSSYRQYVEEVIMALPEKGVGIRSDDDDEELYDRDNDEDYLE